VDTSAETKICPLCAETIKAVAKICPFCQSRLGRYTRWAQEFGPLLVGLVWFGVFGGLMSWVIPNEPGGIERNFARHRSDLGVVETAWDRPSPKAEFWLSGFVTNKANRPWRIHELEIRLLDGNGRILDARHPGIDTPFVVQPGQKHAFRTRFGEVAETNRISRYEVRVHVGSDGNRRYDPD
jgi:hypothetical protein